MKKLICIIAAAVLVLAGCAKEPEFSEHIEPVVSAMVNIPDETYFDPEATLYIGLGVDEPTEEEIKEAEKRAEKIQANWLVLGEKHFSPNCMAPFLNQGIAQMFHALADLEYAESMELKAIELAERSTQGDERVKVTVVIDGDREESFEMTFSYDKDGMIDKVTLPDNAEILRVMEGE